MRIGIMGGTFDPPHLGHVVPVGSVAAEFNLDLVWFIPAYIPPHKQARAIADPFHRAAMVALAIQKYPNFLLSTIELRSGAIRFTLDTVGVCKKMIGSDDQLAIILGSDSFLEIHTWHAYERLIQLCEIIIMNRGDKERELKEKLEQLENILQLDLKQTIHFARAPFLPISATGIRDAIRENRSVSGVLSPEVEAYIRKHSLYQER